MDQNRNGTMISSLMNKPVRGYDDQQAQTEYPAQPGGSGPWGAQDTGYGDKIPAMTLYAATPEQNDEIQRRQNEVNARNDEGFRQDQQALESFGGNVPGSWRPHDVETFDPRSVLGSDAVNLAKPDQATSGGTASAPPADTGGFKLSDKPFIIGFDPDKLASADSGSAAGSKYTPAAKLFGRVAQSVGISRGNLGFAVDQIQKNGFPNAKAVGDDKIDFGDGNGPIDVIRGDGQIVFQNTTNNPTWEKKYAGGAGGSSTGAGSGVGGGSSVNDGGLTNYVNGRLTTGVSDNLKDLLAKYYGLASNGMNINSGTGTSGNGE